MNIAFGREICGNLQQAETREWLVTNGIGGYASGTVAGLLTRRYHGLLVAALKPPLGRTLLLTTLDETVTYGETTYELATNRWVDGTVAPQGYRYIQQFRLAGTIPVWDYACADALLEKRIWMQQGENTTYIQYRYLRGTAPLQLSLKALVNYRDYHGDTQGSDWQMSVTSTDQGVTILAVPEAMPYYLCCDPADVFLAHDWYENFDLAQERYRGLTDHENHLHVATFTTRLEPGQSFTCIASTKLQHLPPAQVLEQHKTHEQDLLQRWQAQYPQVDTPEGIRQLVLAADQFIVDAGPRATILAGYHWFSDWGRDTMISLPGLTLATGRPEIARAILMTYAQYIDQGMLPNRFPDAGEAPEYNTVDATLWYFAAIQQYYNQTQDQTLLAELFPVLCEIIDWHCRGTRYNIHRDSVDGLLYAGVEGTQLTWMDAKVADWVVTPRIGKPIEINALWYNALCSMAQFTQILTKPSADYAAMAAQTQTGFARFWNPQLGYCYDVLDSPKGDDASLRPNQLLAVSLPISLSERLLDPAQEKAIVDSCARALLTSHGLRSLAPSDPAYQGSYGGDQRQRDGAYHQGTVWGWLIGPFAQAHLRVYQQPEQVRQFLAPFAHQLCTHGLGNLSEIFDGDPPFTPRGCIAQAWTVAEVLRVWSIITKH
jgi:predicted glycogen debranching enzyme